MNERIRQLAKEARKYAQQYVNESAIDYGKHANEFLRIYESKFAELIVRECIAKCDDLNSMKYIANHFEIKIEGLNYERTNSRT